VHAERTIHKLVGFTPKHTALQEKTRSDIWGLYRALKEYQTCSSQSQKKILESQFDELFTRKTKWVSLNEALQRIYNNKSELLLVLSRPDIPLHNNLSENDIREYVKPSSTIPNVFNGLLFVIAPGASEEVSTQMPRSLKKARGPGFRELKQARLLRLRI